MGARVAPPRCPLTSLRDVKGGRGADPTLAATRRHGPLRLHMHIEVRLFGTLRDYLPAGSAPPGVRMDVSPGTSIADALAKLCIPPDEVALTVVNGIYERDRQRALEDGAILSLWSHVAGG